MTNLHAFCQRLLEAAGYTVILPAPRVASYTDCYSPCPEGYNTILGYLAQYHPGVLAMFDYTDPTATQRDGFWCMHRTKGEEVWVPAPRCLKARGIDRVRAYPVALLAKRWG